MIEAGTLDSLEFRGRLDDEHLVPDGLLADQEAMDAIGVGIYVMEKDGTLIAATVRRSPHGVGRRSWGRARSTAVRSGCGIRPAT